MSQALSIPSANDLPPDPDLALLNTFLNAPAQDREQAFRTLVNHHAPWIFASASRQLRDPAAAEDATQAVFILFCRRARTIAMHRRNISGWLFVTLSYTIRAVKRADQRRRVREQLAARAEALPAEPPVPAIDLDRAVARLPAADRDAILLRFYQSLPFDQLAIHLELSEPAARKRVSRAIEKLRALLGVDAPESAIQSAALASIPVSAALLSAKISSTTLAASTAALPATVTTALKGATTLMAISKAKIAAVSALAVALFAIPTTIVILQSQPPANPNPASILPADPPPSPEALDLQFKSIYGTTDEPLRRVVNPNPIIRTRFFNENDPERAAHPPLPTAMIIQWRNGKPDLWGWSGTYNVRRLIQHIGRARPWQIEGDQDLFEVPIPGDFVYDRALQPATFLSSIAQFATEETAAPGAISIAWKEVERPVIVFKGTWRFTPVDDRKTDTGTPVVEIYGEELIRPISPGAEGRGSAEDTAMTLSDYLERPIFIEAQNFPPEIKVHDNALFTQDKQVYARYHNPDLVLKHFEEQTNLHPTTETRKIKILSATRNRNP